MFEVSVTVHAPEANAPGAPPMIVNPAYPHVATMLQTLGWTPTGKRERGRDHWQLLRHKTTPQDDEDDVICVATSKVSSKLSDEQKRARKQ
jgi:hypothetical protein